MDDININYIYIKKHKLQKYNEFWCDDELNSKTWSQLTKKTLRRSNIIKQQSHPLKVEGKK